MFSKYNAYIIKEADKLNSTSANILLKFLEEPDTRTLAFFVTKNSKNVLSTIKSRCQLLKDNFYETFWQSHSITEKQYQEHLLIANKMMDYSGSLWLDGKKIFKNFLGQGVVVTFLMYSGYGIMQGIKLKGNNYIKSLPSKTVKLFLYFNAALSLYFLLNIFL